MRLASLIPLSLAGPAAAAPIGWRQGDDKTSVFPSNATSFAGEHQSLSVATSAPISATPSHDSFAPTSVSGSSDEWWRKKRGRSLPSSASTVVVPQSTYTPSTHNPRLNASLPESTATTSHPAPSIDNYLAFHTTPGLSAPTSTSEVSEPPLDISSQNTGGTHGLNGKELGGLIGGIVTAGSLAGGLLIRSLASEKTGERCSPSSSWSRSVCGWKRRQRHGARSNEGFDPQVLREVTDNRAPI